MDHCLRIPELVHSICRELDKASSISVALACRAFLDPALDRIWQDIWSLQPLISCLPGDIWKDDDGKPLSLRTSLTPEHMRRYLTQYAHRIRSFAPYWGPSTTKGHLSVEALQALQMATDYRPGALSPRLRTFYWTSAHHQSPSTNYPVGFFDPFTSLFIGESVEALDVIGTRDDPLYVGSLTLAARRLPRLKQLWMSSHMTGIPFVLWFMTSFPWGFLEEVCLDRVSAKVISALARMPCLRKLRLLDLETMYLAPLAEGSHVEAAPLTDFASLRMLDITSWNLVSVKGLLQVVSPSNRVERVVSTCPDSAPLSDCQGTISAIEEYCNPHTLQSIKIMDNISYSWEPGDRLDVYPDPREMDLDISGLSKFTNLQELVILWEKSVRLSPREIGLIPTWWPHIRHLDLCQQYPSEGRTPAIDHTHLLELVRGCPLLRFIGLRFDTTGIPGEHQDHVETFRLEVLRVSGSPIVSPSRVAAFIRIHFPRLAKLDFKYNAVVEREPTIVNRRWAAVAEALTGHR